MNPQGARCDTHGPLYPMEQRTALGVGFLTGRRKIREKVLPDRI